MSYKWKFASYGWWTSFYNLFCNSILWYFMELSNYPFFQFLRIFVSSTRSILYCDNEKNYKFNAPDLNVRNKNKFVEKMGKENRQWRHSFPACSQVTLENYYSNLIAQHIERKQRLAKLEESLKDEGLSEQQKQEKRQQHAQKETEFLRLKRSRLGVEDFEPLKVIGRGAFGEVRRSTSWIAWFSSLPRFLRPRLDLSVRTIFVACQASHVDDFRQDTFCRSNFWSTFSILLNRRAIVKFFSNWQTFC